MLQGQINRNIFFVFLEFSLIERKEKKYIVRSETLLIKNEPE